MKPVLKHWQDPKYYDHDCLKIFLSLTASLLMVWVSNNSSFVSQKMKFYWRKHNKNQTLKLSNIKMFDLHQRRLLVFTENCWISNFSACHFLYICIKILRKTLKFSKMSKYWSLKETGADIEHNFAYTDNPGQIISIRERKSSKTVQHKKNLRSIFT